MRRILIILFLMMLIGIVNAAATYTEWVAYGDAFKSTNDTYTVIKWNTTGARAGYVVTGNASSVDYVVVGGGGGGGYRYGTGGGGAGAFWEGALTGLSGTQTVTVGAGGAEAASAVSGDSGGNSVFGSITANGGSGGASRTASVSLVIQGGSAGGGGAPATAATGESNSTNQGGHGNRGGTGVYVTSTSYSGGGGGSAITLGTNASTVNAGDGGEAAYTNITGTRLTLAGGGGGGTYSTTESNRGQAGANATTGVAVGGLGAYRTTAGTNPTASTGSGGGGAGSAASTGTSGSGGVVIIRFVTPPPPPVAAFTSNVTIGYSPLGVQFNDTSTNTPTSWAWSYKNETVGWTAFSTSRNATLSFPEGLYDINLTATNAYGSDDEIKTWYIGSNRAAINASAVESPERHSMSSTFTNLRNGVGTVLYDDLEYKSAWIKANATTSARYDLLARAARIYDTSSIPDNATILSVNETVYGNYYEDDLGISDIGVTGFTPATPGVIVIADFNTYGNTRYATDLNRDTDLVADQWNTWIYTADGLAAINKTGNTNVMHRLKWDIDNSTTGLTWGGGLGSGMFFDTNNTVYKPYLKIIYTTGGGTAPVASFTKTATVLRIPKILTVTDTSTNTPTSWAWSWGDGTANSTTQNPTHQYTKRGIFTINLAATNAGGTGTATAQTVRVVGYENLW